MPGKKKLKKRLKAALRVGDARRRMSEVLMDALKNAESKEAKLRAFVEDARSFASGIPAVSAEAAAGWKERFLRETEGYGVLGP